MRILWILLITTLSLFAQNDIHIEKIKAHINKTFLKTYPNMHIHDLTILRESKTPKEFQNYKLNNIYISSNNLKRERGSVSVTFIHDKKKRKLYYSYKLDASVDVLRANQYIQKNKTLTADLVDFVPIKFTNFYQKPITAYHLNRYRARTTIIEGKILTLRHISKVTAIKRGDTLTATLRDGGIVVSFKAKALKDAYIGDVIKIRKDHNNFFQAKIISNSQAEVIE